MNEEVLHFIPWDIKDRMFAQLQKKIIRTYLKKKEKKKDLLLVLQRAIWAKEGKTTQHPVS